MRIEFDDFCTTQGVYIDGEYANNLTIEQLIQAITECALYTNNKDFLIEALRDVCTNDGIEEDLGKCEQCGDYNFKYTLNTNENCCGE